MSSYQKEVKDVFKELESSEKGLSSKEVTKRIQKYGLNKIGSEKKVSFFQLLAHQFNDPLIWVLIFATILSFVIKNYVDAIIILIVILFDAGFGLFQEYKAEKAILLLRKLRQYKSRVFRDGKDMLVDSDTLVPGDILIFEEGDKIPADCRVLSLIDLEVDEASLTGESKAVKKTIEALKTDKLVLGDQKNMLFAGTVVVRGKGKAVVVATGMYTELGKIAKELESIEEEQTPLQKKLKEIGKWLTIIVAVICVLVFGLGILRGFAVVEMLLTSVSLAVAAIPEGLPAVVTITLALGLRRMLRRKALIRQLQSVETLGSVTVICSDKTGTLTKNEMTVTDMYSSFQEYTVTGSGYSLHGEILFQGKKCETQSLVPLLLVGTSCNNATLEIGDPTEKALQVLAVKGKVVAKERASEVPFSSDTKFMSVTDKEGVVYMKGAVEVVLEKCHSIFVHGSLRKITAQDRKKILEQNELYSKKALRVLACASGKKELVFVGLVGMIDPPREEVKDAMILCERAGIRSVMITGDHELTARAVAVQVGIKGESLQGSVLDSLTDKELQKIVKKISIYARVNSLHKARILKALQANGEIVAMTGDGVNDAPALKQANVGVAMNIKGTDVSKDVSDLILLDDNFATIVAAVEEGRIIYSNIKKFVKYLLSANFGEVALVFGSLLMGFPLPLLPIQLLWVNLVTDSFPALALGVDPADPQIMKKKPRDPSESFFSRMKFFLIVSTVFSVLLTMGLFLFYYGMTGDLDKTRTVVFTALILFELFLVFACRSEDGPLYTLKSNWWLYGAVALSLGLHLILLYGPFAGYFSLVPLTFLDWVWIVPLSAVGFLFFEVKKIFLRKYLS